MRYVLVGIVVLLLAGCTVIIVDSKYREHEKMSIGASTSSYNTNEGNSSSE